MLEYGVLGTLTVTRDGEPIEVSRPLERRLLALLLANRNRALSDEQVFHSLWPGGLPRDPGPALRTTVSRLRGTLGSPDVIRREPAGYTLSADPGSVDADRFEALLKTDDPVRRADVLRQALDLWASEEAYAEFRYDDLIHAEADRLNALRLQTYEALASERLASGESDALVPDLRRMVANHPLREPLYELLMLALYRAGRRTEALRVFQTAKSTLGEEMGLEPSAGLVDLEERMLLEDPGLDLAAPPSANNLPSRINSFVGQECAVAELVERVNNHRVVTVTGPAGVGKTTVAIEAARRLVSLGQGECWFLDLGQVDVGGPLEPYVVDELASLIPKPPDMQTLEFRLSQLIGTERMLILIDNCEHVISEISDIVGTLIRECPNLTVLATSRERLGLAGEAIVPIAPLFAGDEHDYTIDPAEALRAYPALALFRDRCESASPEFRLTRREVPTALRVCRLLDGLPLAIELAAARITSHSITDLERLLERRLSLGTQRGVAARHRSLSAAIDWSYELLDERDRAALEMLAQMNGPFTIADVACIATDGDEAEAATVTASLHDKSLINHSGEFSATTQFEMLGTIRGYALSKAVEAGRSSEHELRHARCFLAMAVQAAPELLGGPRQLQWMNRCTQNSTDFLQAVRVFLANGRAEEALSVIANVGVAWTRYRVHLEGYPVICDALDAVAPVVFDSTPRVQVLAAWMSPDAPGRPFRNGLAHAHEALRTAEIVGDTDSAIAARAFVGLNQWLRGDDVLALDSVSAAVRLVSEDEGWDGDTALIIGGIVEHALDPSSAAYEYFERAVESCRERSDGVGEATALGFLGSALKDHGYYSRARSAFRTAHIAGLRVGDPTVAIVGAAGLALTSWIEGDHDDAEVAANRALELMNGLTLGAKDGSLSQLFLSPEAGSRFAALESGLDRVAAQPATKQARAFIGLLLELAEYRAVRHLDGERVTEIRAALDSLRMRKAERAAAQR